eukprot:TRINITY_DN4137_c0_g2_i1.p1 TRINITY_DN4137_c0_g2~~TRINITY_DN4137_c0_g2_i1.p1  ORF type:complete len:443 (-),score=84.61 TRINITY_DN4137_c0_g2_i1:136-1464(-)
MGEIVWDSLTIISEIIPLIDSATYDGSPYLELEEIRETITKSKTTLVQHYQTEINDPAYNICLQGIKNILEKIKSYLENLNLNLSLNGKNVLNENEIKYNKIYIFRNDLLLEYRLRQFIALFPSSNNRENISNIIKDRTCLAFWLTSFGENSLMIPWKHFFKTFEKYLSKNLKPKEKYLKNFLNFTHDDYVTGFEFNMFVRWFGPLCSCTDRLIETIKSGILSGFIPAIEATSILENEGLKTGTFLIRFSKSRIECFALAFVDSQNCIKHSLLKTEPSSGIKVGNLPILYKSLNEFVNDHKNKLTNSCNVCFVGKDNEDLLKVNDELNWDEKNDDLDNNNICSFDNDDNINNNNNNNNNNSSIEKNSIPSINDCNSSIFEPPSDEQNSKNEEDLCVVCMDAPKESIFLECAHFATCKNCASKMKVCCVCRAPIERVVNVFMS